MAHRQQLLQKPTNSNYEAILTGRLSTNSKKKSSSRNSSSR